MTAYIHNKTTPSSQNDLLRLQTQFIHTPTEIIRFMVLEVDAAKSYAAYLDTYEDLIFARGFAMGAKSMVDYATGKMNV